MNEQEAAQKAEQIIQETVAVLNPKPRLEPGSFMGSGQCLDPTDGGSEERIEVTRDYWLRDIQKDQNTAVAQQILTFWKSKNWRITGTQGWERNMPDITAYTRPDDFLVSLETNSQGDLSLGATSPCIWPKGKPE